MQILKAIFKINAVHKGVIGDSEIHMYRTSYVGNNANHHSLRMNTSAIFDSKMCYLEGICFFHGFKFVAV